MMINNHRSIENSEGFEKSFSAEEKSSFNKINNAVSDFAQERGISREKSAEIFGSIGIEASKGFNIAGFGSNGEVSGSFTSGSRNSNQEHFKEALNFSNQRSLSKDFANVESAVNANRLNYTDSKGESINQTFNQSVVFRQNKYRRPHKPLSCILLPKDGSTLAQDGHDSSALRHPTWVLTDIDIVKKSIVFEKIKKDDIAIKATQAVRQPF